MVDCKEFQAVVLAGGKGSRMLDLTKSKPKCFLPIGNRPMIWYPLTTLQKMGFQHVIVITDEQAKPEVANLSKKLGLELQLDVVTLPNSQGDLGTADALKLVHSKLYADNVVIVSSDLVVDFSQIRHLVDLHHLNKSSLTALFAPFTLDTRAGHVPGPKAKHIQEKDLVGIDLSNSQLCYLSSEADLEDDISLNMALLNEHPKLTIHSNLLDAHFYVLNKGICDFIAANRYNAIKGELLPFLVQYQFNAANRSPDDKGCEEDSSGQKAAVCDRDIRHFVSEDAMVKQIRSLSSWNDHIGDLKGTYRNRPLRCYAFLMAEGSACTRVNTIMTYCEINRRIGHLWPVVVGDREMQPCHPNSRIDAKAQVGSESFIAADVVISDRAIIKNCVIGANCRIEEGVRLDGCILMERVVVKSGSIVLGSLICDEVSLGEKCQVKDTIVCKGQKVGPAAKLTNVVFDEDAVTLMEF